MIEDIPNDVLLEIFMRLSDCQSLIRCSSVSKRWRSLITGNSRLERRFNLRYPEICTQLIGYGAFRSALHRYCVWTSLEKSSAPLPEFGLDFLPWAREEGLTIRASVGDLLLVSRRNGDTRESYDRDFLVCNPFTEQVVRLPRSPANFARGRALVLESKSCGARVGCNCNVRYRVALLAPPTPGNLLLATVFCSETGRWAESSHRYPPKSHGRFVAINDNVLHWLSGDRYIATYDPFRLPGERLGSVGLPDEYSKAPTEDLLLGSVGGRLRFAQTIHVEGRKLLRVWERSPCESWVLEHDSVEVVEHRLAYVVGFNKFDGDMVFMMGRGEEEEEEASFVYNYDIKERRFRQLGRFPPEEIDY